MCILIIAGKNSNALVEIGINNSAEMYENEGNEDFFENNSGPENIYPGGSTCTVLENKVFFLFVGSQMVVLSLKY